MGMRDPAGVDGNVPSAGFWVSRFHGSPWIWGSGVLWNPWNWGFLGYGYPWGSGYGYPWGHEYGYTGIYTGCHGDFGRDGCVLVR